MKIYYDNISKNIVLGDNTRLFAVGSLLAEEFRGRVSVIYKNTNFRELYVKFEKVQKEDGSPAGTTLQEVIDYLNFEFNKSPFNEIQPNFRVVNVSLSGLTRTVLPAEHMLTEYYSYKTVNSSGKEISLAITEQNLSFTIESNVDMTGLNLVIRGV